MKKVKVALRDGLVVEGDACDQEDYLKLKEIFKDWILINGKIKPLGGRGLNVPDVFSEALFCIFFNSQHGDIIPAGYMRKTSRFFIWLCTFFQAF